MTARLINPVWKDSTRYSRDVADADRVPHAWTLERPTGSRLQITVMDHHMYFKPGWAMYVLPFMSAARGCVATTREAAQDEAIAYAQAEINKLQADLNRALWRSTTEEKF